MALLFILGALILPPAIILARPRRVPPAQEWRLRIAGSIASVWLMGICLVLRGQTLDYGTEYKPRERATPLVTPTPPVSPTPPTVGDPAKPADPAVDPSKSPPSPKPAEDTDADNEPPDDTMFTGATSDSGWVLLLGWVPGAVYTGLLVLAKKGLEADAPRFTDPRLRRRGPQGPMGW